MKDKFYGWWITFAAFCTFGLSTGLPYYNMPFFYDYYEKTFGWARPDITYGYPLAALLTLWVGPVIVHRFSPRWLIIAGTGFDLSRLLRFQHHEGRPVYLQRLVVRLLIRLHSLWPNRAPGDHLELVSLQA
jgi:hypothetical protein